MGTPADKGMRRLVVVGDNTNNGVNSFIIMKISNTLILVLICLVFTWEGVAQDSSIYSCNVYLITKHPACDSLRDMSRLNPKVNYRKMMRKDRKIIFFLNMYHSDTLSLMTLEEQIKKLNYYGEKTHAFSDTISRQLIIYEKGLLKLLITYRYKQGKIEGRYYSLEINNPLGAGDSRPLDYHYKVFKLLNFCLEERFGCYDFGGTF